MHYCLVPRDAAYYQVRFSWWICLPRSTSTPFNHLFRQMAALSLLRLHILSLIHISMPVFLTMTKGMDDEERRHIVKRATIISFITLLALSLIHI